MPYLRFRPPWWATLATLLLGAVFATAGFWQLARSGEKRALLAAFEAQPAGQAESLPLPGEQVTVQRYRRIGITGRYDAARQMLLDARIRDGRAGYEVLTPLITAERIVLVNRGWIAANPDRRLLPDIDVGDGERLVIGLLDRLPRAALSSRPEAAEEHAAWPRRLLYPDAQTISAALGRPVEDYQLLLVPEALNGYRRDWRPQFLSPRQHLGYALQWFALTGALVVIYVALNIRKATCQPI